MTPPALLSSATEQCPGKTDTDTSADTIDSIPSCNDPAFDRDGFDAIPPSPTRLPVADGQIAFQPKPNLWNILKNAIGKDLSSITLPVNFNEPLSFLQRLAEDVEHSNLLDEAAEQQGADRMALVAAFVTSHYSSTFKRTTKPFNPLLGETFDLVIPGKLALVAEQVTHHPPVSAIFAKGRRWTYHTAHKIKNKFKGNSLEVWPEGAVHLKFDDGEHYVYEQAHNNVHNIIFGGLWIETVGPLSIREVSKRQWIAELTFDSSASMLGATKRVGQFTGKISSLGRDGKVGKTSKKLKGNWTSHFLVDGKSVWQVTPRPARDATRGFPMTAWAWGLNAEVEDRKEIPVTDSRRRPDQRALEHGHYALAASEKSRLEDAQRRRRDSTGNNLEPRWFELQMEPVTARKEWKYVGDYFGCKNGEWPEEVPSIF